MKAVATALQSARSTFVQELGARYQVNFYEFADEFCPARSRTCLARGSERDEKPTSPRPCSAANASPGRRLAGILLVSDGRDNAGGDVARVATHLKSLKVPVWTTGVGSLTETRDLYVTARLNQNFCFVNQPASIKVDLSRPASKTGMPR